MIRPERIAHVVIKVRDLERSKKFYTEVLGMQVMKDTPEIRGVFLANHTRDHHEIALFQIGPDAEPPRPDPDRTRPYCLSVAERRGTQSRL